MQDPELADREMLMQASAGAQRVLDYLTRTETDLSSDSSHRELPARVADAKQSLAVLLETDAKGVIGPMTTEQQEQTDSNEPIVARAGTYYRNARYIMFAIIVAFGLWFLYDGFKKYPAQNAQFAALTSKIEQMERDPSHNPAELLSLTMKRKELSHHDEFSIRLQKILGFALPPVGLSLLIFWLRRSRGEIRLENDVITCPGFQPVPLKAIDELDQAMWERKGIAYVYYTLNGASGRLRLDDFVYQANPIREIVGKIEEVLEAKDSLAASKTPNIQPPRPVRGAAEAVEEK